MAFTILYVYETQLRDIIIILKILYYIGKYPYSSSIFVHDRWLGESRGEVSHGQSHDEHDVRYEFIMLIIMLLLLLSIIINYYRSRIFSQIYRKYRQTSLSPKRLVKDRVDNLLFCKIYDNIILEKFYEFIRNDLNNIMLFLYA